jgi:cell wall-associated NlpC family hydrolase
MQFTTLVTLVAATLAAAAPAPVPDTDSSKNGDGLVDAAKKELGVPYVYGGGGCGGKSDGGFDCSGLTQYAGCQALHKTIPRTAQEQYDSSMGKKIKRSDAQEGDFLFWGTDGNCKTGVEHVGISMGDSKKGYFINAAHTGTPVREEKIWTSSGGLSICDDAVRFW